eukprot:Gb_26683 [translate_table: standard]
MAKGEMPILFHNDGTFLQLTLGFGSVIEIGYPTVCSVSGQALEDCLDSFTVFVILIFGGWLRRQPWLGLSGSRLQFYDDGSIWNDVTHLTLQLPTIVSHLFDVRWDGLAIGVQRLLDGFWPGVAPNVAF